MSKSVRARAECVMAWRMKQSWRRIGFSGSHSQPFSKLSPDRRIQKFRAQVHGYCIQAAQLLEQPINRAAAIEGFVDHCSGGSELSKSVMFTSLLASTSCRKDFCLEAADGAGGFGAEAAPRSDPSSTTTGPDNAS